MTKPALLELMNRDIDGNVTAAEREELRQQLEVNAEARTQYEHLVLAAAALRRVPRVDPPQNLKNAVMTGISHPKTQPSEKILANRRLWNRLESWWAVGISPRFLSGAVAGASVVVIMGLVFGFYGQPSSTDVTGTLVPSPAMSAQLVSSYSVSADQTSANVVTTRLHDRVVVQIKVSSPVNANIQLGFDPNDLKLVDASRNGQLLTSVSPSAGTVSLPPTSDGALTVTFEDRTDRSSTIHVSVSDNNVTATQEVVTGGSTTQQK